MQTGEVNISFIHDIETSLFITQLIQHVYVMYFGIGYQYDCRYGSLYIIQGMKFDASFVLQSGYKQILRRYDNLYSGLLSPDWYG